MQSQLDPVVCHAPLREVISADLFRAVSCPDLAPSRLRLRRLLFLKFKVIQLGAQQAERFLLVLKLRFLRLAVNYDTCREMSQRTQSLSC